MHNEHNLKALLRDAMQADGGLAVFKYYGFEPSKRPQKENPFRQERTSSFFVNHNQGKYYFKDFGDDAYKGNAWKFVQMYENTQDNALIFQTLCGIYGLGFQALPTRALPTKIPAKANPKAEDDFQKTLKSITFREFTQKELDFWYAKGYITKDTLKQNGVQAVESFQIEVQAGKVAKYEHLAFVFAYEIVQGKAYKLYMPKPEHRVYAKAKTIFLPTLQPAKELYGENFAYHFGLETLRKEPFILCGGEPDCLALKNMGYNALTLGDERTQIPAYIWEMLKQKWQIENPETYLQSILYDTDFTGIAHSRKLAKAMQVPAITLPKLYQQTTREQPKPTQNDLCDYLGLYGNDAPLAVALHKRHVRTRDYALPAIPRFEVGKYLSEQIDVLTEFIRTHKKIQIDADTGVGKTFTVLSDLPARLQKTILFAVPFAIQVEQIEQEYAQIVDDLVCFTNQETQALSEEDKMILMNRPAGKVNVCTIDRIKAVYERLELEHGNDLVVVIDESHLLTSEYGYRMGAIHDVLEVCRKVEKVIYLSATPDYSLCRFSGFKLIQFRRKTNPHLEIQALDYEGSPKQNVWRLLANHAEDRGGVTVVRLNNKTLAKVIANLLITEGKFKADEIDFVFSEKRKGLSTPSRESIIHHAEIPENVRLLFVTACFDCGINIKNTNIQRVISFETQYTDNCLDTLKQLVARFRCVDKLAVTVCKPLKYQTLPALKSKANLYERLKQDAEAKLRLLPYLDESTQTSLKQPFAKLPAYLKHNPDISAIHKLIFWNKRKNNYQINYNHIRFTLKEYERKNMNSMAFFEYLAYELPCVTLVGKDKINAPMQEIQKQQLAELLAVEKCLKEGRQAVISLAMQQNAPLFFDAVYSTYRDQSLKEKIKKHFAISSSKDAPSMETVLNLSLENTQTQKHEIHNFDEDITTFSHRYFYLLDLRIPKEKIPCLLKQYTSNVQFGELIRMLNNQIQILAYQETNKEMHKLSPDARKDIDAKWLHEFIEKVPTWNAPTFSQKKNGTLVMKLQDAQKRLEHLRTAENIITEDVQNLKTQEANGIKCRSALRDAVRKEASAKARVSRQADLVGKLKASLEQSEITGWEIQTLSDRINRTRLHASDWQSPKVNLRLLQSLFETSTQKRAVLLPNPENAKESLYVEKTFISIGTPLTFPIVLQKIGFTEMEASNYLTDLRYQIHLDIQTNSAKFTDKSHQDAKEIIALGALSDSVGTLAQASAVLLNENGYPVGWDL